MAIFLTDDPLRSRLFLQAPVSFQTALKASSQVSLIAQLPHNTTLEAVYLATGSSN